MAVDRSPHIAIDARALDALRRDAQTDPRKALRGAATQFEAIFVNMLLKSMRESLPQDGLFSSDTTRLYTSMLDQQFAQGVAAKGLGLADALVKQLERHPSVAGKDTPAPAAPAPTQPSPARDAAGPSSFIDRLMPHAQAAAAATGIPAGFIVGQAGLESGWGAKEIRGADGAQSYNLFGIKAGDAWTGRTVDVQTTEYVGDVAHKVVQRFRAYDSYVEAFADWAKLVTKSARYAKAVAPGNDVASFAREIQAAGYATDPAYAEKLTRAINHALLRRSAT